MKQIMNKLVKIASEYTNTSVLNTHSIFEKACGRVYNNYIQVKRVILKHYISDELLDDEALELTERYFRMRNYKNRKAVGGER